MQDLRTDDYGRFTIDILSILTICHPDCCEWFLRCKIEILIAEKDHKIIR
jgi:hypothetical protein